MGGAPLIGEVLLQITEDDRLGSSIEVGTVLKDGTAINDDILSGIYDGAKLGSSQDTALGTSVGPALGIKDGTVLCTSEGTPLSLPHGAPLERCDAI